MEKLSSEVQDGKHTFQLKSGSSSQCGYYDAEHGSCHRLASDEIHSREFPSVQDVDRCVNEEQDSDSGKVGKPPSPHVEGSLSPTQESGLLPCPKCNDCWALLDRPQEAPLMPRYVRCGRCGFSAPFTSWQARVHWQPINTAPKDSSWILAVMQTGRQVVIRWGGGAWEDDNRLCRDPTHWMPLPEPPLQITGARK